MRRISHIIRASLGLATLISVGTATAGTNSPAVLFNRDIRPILSDTCFPCHGFDPSKRKADLRLDTAEGMQARHETRQAVKPGDLAASELWKRVNSADPKLCMPPPDSGKKLTAEQLASLRRWIEQGAPFQKHWAFEAPVRPDLPAVTLTNRVRNPVDRFILARLEQQKLQPSPEAAKEKLIRRVSLDLTGLPPSLPEVDAFLADAAPDAYERLVDRLLASPRYGEHMARYWLDLARYGDTHGLHLDNERSLWPYRDWVVSAFNQNLPFNQFTIWQLAGDLLPNPTREQLVASGFNRCNVSTSEGGAIDEEFQVRYAVDRVETTSTTWMGLTMGCAVCHDHKLDPITQKEFYEMFSIFNNISEKAMDGNALLPPPTLRLPTPEQEKKLAELETRQQALQKQARDIAATINYVDPASLTNFAKPEPKEIVWIEDDFPEKADLQVDGPPVQWIAATNGPVLSGKRALRRAGAGLHQVYFTSCANPLTVHSGDRFFTYVYFEQKDRPKSVMLQFFAGGWNQRANWGNADAIPYGAKGTFEKVQVGPLPKAGSWARLEVTAAALGLTPGTRITGLALTQFGGTVYWDKTGMVAVDNPAENPGLSLLAWEKAERARKEQSTAPQPIKDLLAKEPGKLAEAERAQLRQHYLSSIYSGPAPGLDAVRKELGAIAGERQEVEKQVSSTMISQELPKPRPAWVLVRGQYDKHGEAVGPGVPAVLPPLPAGEGTNRLSFAHWLVSPSHPLTARVAVNHYWQQCFGVGLVKTAEDFGSRGEWPSHPELLDWLATEFIHSGWNVKQLMRLLVTSAIYRQDSRVTPELAALDPENRLLARGPRYRLDAEQLRDYALDVAGLLNLQTGGRGVRSYQPPGIWEAVAYTTSNTSKYSQDHGDALYRRSLYLFWKRTAPPPSMTTFDAPSREQCRARRERTDTPLQALLLMNDPQYFEAARHLGYRMLREGGADDARRVAYGFRLTTDRSPSPKEATVLAESLAAQRMRYRADEAAAKKVITVGESPAPKDVEAAELAAYTMVANLLLNLDEVITKN